MAKPGEHVHVKNEGVSEELAVRGEEGGQPAGQLVVVGTGTCNVARERLAGDAAAMVQGCSRLG